MGKDKSKARYDNMEAWDKSYDSDKDLTKKEQEKINYSRDPKKTREDIWETKGTWKKTKKMLKSGFYGDKKSK